MPSLHHQGKDIQFTRFPRPPSLLPAEELFTSDKGYYSYNVAWDGTGAGKNRMADEPLYNSVGPCPTNVAALIQLTPTPVPA